MSGEQLLEKFQKFLKRYRKPNGDKLLEKTLDIYSYYLKDDIEQLDRLEGQELLDYAQRMVNMKQAHVLYSALRMYFYSRGYEQQDKIVKLLKPPRRKATSKSSIRFLQSKLISKQEMNRLFNELDDFEKMIIAVAYSTACRRAELLGIKFGDIEFYDEPKDNIYASVNVIGKSAKSREVYLDKRSVELIRKVHKDYNDDTKLIVFYGRNGLPVKNQDNALYKRFRRVTKKILGRECHVHMLRHSVITNMSDTGIDILGISRYAGHSDIKVTAQTYSKVTKFQGKQAFKNFQEEKDV